MVYHIILRRRKKTVDNYAEIKEIPLNAFDITLTATSTV